MTIQEYAKKKEKLKSTTKENAVEYFLVNIFTSPRRLEIHSPREPNNANTSIIVLFIVLDLQALAMIIKSMMRFLAGNWTCCLVVYFIL